MSGRHANLRKILWVILAALLTFNTVMLLREPTLRTLFTPSFITEWFRVGRVMRLVHARHVDADKVGFDQLARRACDGAASKLDRYSEYLDEEDYAAQNRHADQLFTGIGVVMSPVDGLVCVSKLMPGGGAEAAGLLPGDRILSADGTDLTGLSLDEVGGKIRGPADTFVTLTLRRPGSVAPFEARVARRTITLSTVSESRLLPDGRTALVGVSGFEKLTPREVREAVEKHRAAGANRLILDLRGNPGGLVDAAVGVLALFCPAESVAARLEGRTEDDSHEYRTHSEPVFPKMPLVVLIDGHSASASEILAGALRDHRRAVLVGSRTFGKGLVQSIFQLDDRTGLKLTTAHYALPGGAHIHGVGVPPDVTVAETPGAAIRRLSEESLVAHGGGTEAFIRRFGYAPVGDAALETAGRILAAAAPRRPAGQMPPKPL